MAGSPLGMRRRGGEPGASFSPHDDADQSTDKDDVKRRLGEGLRTAFGSKATGAPASNEAPRPAMSAASAPERQEKGAEVRKLEARYDEIVDDQIDAQGRRTDASLIKSAALARKGSFVVSAMAEPTNRFQALSRRIEELVGLDNAELAKIANEPMPEAVPETTPEAVPRAVEARTEPVPETRTAGRLEHLDSIEGLQDAQGRIDEAMFEELILEGLSNPKTAWDKVDGTWADLVTVEKILSDLKIDKAKPQPEFPFLKINRINSALEAVRASIAKKDQIEVIVNAHDRAVDIATVAEAARGTATRIAGGEIAPTVAREMSPNEKLAHMKKQFNIKDAALDSLILKLNDYLKIPGLFRGLRTHARDLKRQIRDLEAEQYKLSKAIYARENNPNEPSAIVRPKDSQARDERITKPTEKSPY